MDTDVLVDDRIEDGQRLVTQLVRDRFEVRAAFWVKTSEESLWQLCIASPSIDAAHLGDAYSTVFAALGKTPDCSVVDTRPRQRPAPDRYPAAFSGCLLWITARRRFNRCADEHGPQPWRPGGKI